jgi:hypothetical protein
MHIHADAPIGRLKDMKNDYIKFLRKFRDNPSTGKPASISTWLYLLLRRYLNKGVML